MRFVMSNPEEFERVKAHAERSHEAVDDSAAKKQRIEADPAQTTANAALALEDSTLAFRAGNYHWIKPKNETNLLGKKNGNLVL